MLFPPENPVGVILVLPNLEPGGAQIQGLRLAHDLRDRGLAVVIALTHSSKATLDNLRDREGFEVVYVPALFTWRDGAELLLRLCRKLAGFFGFWRFSGHIKQVLARSLVNKLRRETSLSAIPGRHLKVLISSRNLRRFIEACGPRLVISLVEESNVVSLIASADLVRCVVMERNDFDRKPVSADIQSARIELYPRAVMVFANSRNSQSQLERHFPSARVDFFPNSYPPQCQRASLPVERTILVVGRLETQKDPLGALEGFHASHLWQNGWSLVFVGSGTLEATLKVRSEELHISKCVNFLGHVERQRIPFQSASYVILNSLYEGSPNVLAECISAGRLPIVRDTVQEAKEFIPSVARSQLVHVDVEELGQRLASLNQMTDEYFELSKVLQEAYVERIAEYETQRGAILSRLELMARDQEFSDGRQISES